jgi:hypothetical protein
MWYLRTSLFTPKLPPFSAYSPASNRPLPPPPMTAYFAPQTRHKKSGQAASQQT